MTAETKGLRTRRAVLDAAVSLSSTEGLEGLTIGTLADHVGLSKSGLYAHFRSKEELQLQVIRRARDRFVERVLAPALRRPRGARRLVALVDGWLDWDADPELPGGCVFMAYAKELDARPGPLREALAAAQREWRGALATAARKAIEEGEFRADLDVDAFTFELHGIVLASNYYERLLDDSGARRRARAALASLLDRARAGSGAGPGPGSGAGEDAP